MLHIFYGRRIADVLFEFFPEMTDGACHRPRRRISQWTDCFSIDFLLDIPKQINVCLFAVSVENAMKDFFLSPGSFPAGRTLSAAFVVIEACEVPEIFNHACRFV